MTTQHSNRVIVAMAVTATGIALLVVWFGGDLFDWSKSTETNREMLAGISIAFAVAFACHWFIRRWLIACTVCTVTLTVFVSVVLAASGSSAGAFWLIGLFTTALASFVLAAFVGVVFLVLRRGAKIK